MKLERLIQRIWSDQNFWAALLFPLSLLYGSLIRLRRHAYRFKLFQTSRVDAIVIVIGNVVAGGAGKTPTAISVVHHLASKGYKVGIVSRGYGRANDECQEVLGQSSVSEVGDEPMVLKNATGAPVFVGRNRALAVQKLLMQYPQVQIIVADDGLQHFALYRDIEICVFDNRGLGNGWLLPAGPLREAWPRLALRRIGARLDRFLVLHTGNHPAFAGFKASRTLATHGVCFDGTSVPLQDISKLRKKPVLALAGIAHPTSFFEMLQGAGVEINRTLSLPDHFPFDRLTDIDMDFYQILCTEKDAVKLWKLAPHAIAVPLIQTVEPTFFSALDVSISECISARLSSRNGYQTT